MHALIALYQAQIKEFMRDRMAMFWTFAFPIFFILIFGLIFSGSSGTTFDVGLAVEDKGPIGTTLSNAFNQLEAFELTTGDRASLQEKLTQGDFRVLIVIPDGISNAVTAGQPANVEVYYDPSNQTTAQIVLAIVEKVVEGVDRQITQRPTLLSMKTHTITAERLRSIDFLLPGILAMSLMQLGLFSTAPVLVQLREQHILRRIGATPLPRITLLASQVLHRLTIGLSQMLIIVLVGVFVFDVQIVGNLAALLGVVLLGALLFITMGYLISGLAKTQESVIGISQLINFPMMFLSGLFFPIEVMPAWIRPVATVLPLTYLADALRQIMVGAPPLHPLLLDVVLLALGLIICGALAVRFFRWEA